MKQRVINGHALEFFDSSNTKKGEIKISGSNIIINPLDANGTVIFGEEGTVNDIEVGAVGTPVDFTFAGGGTLTSNGGTLTIGNTGDTIDLSSATIGAITASAFVGGTFEGNGSGLTGVVPDLSGYNGNVVVTGSLQVTGKVTAEEFHTEFVSASIMYKSGSTKFGDTADDTHSFTGSLSILHPSAYGAKIDLRTSLHKWTLEGGEAGYSADSLALDYDGSTFIRMLGTSDVRIGAGLAVGGIGVAAPSNGLYVAGNVGINNASPIVPLDIEGTVRIRGNGSRRLDLDSDVKITGQYYSNSSTEHTYLKMYNGANASINMGTKHPLSYISFESGNGAYTERMRITNTGNVGIGTTSPSDKLDVFGDLRVSYDVSNYFAIEPISNGNAYFKASGGSLHFAQTSKNNQIFLYDYTGATTRWGEYDGSSIKLKTSSNTTGILLDTDGNSYINTGNVGIGTTSPSSKLHVNGSSKFELPGALNNVYIEGPSNNTLFYAKGEHVGIGTTSPSASLQVEGSADVVNIIGSGSTANTSIFAIDGNNGRLFEVSDDLSDSLFSVNTIAGLPVMEVFSDNRITMGAFNQNDLVISGSRVGIGTDSLFRGNLVVRGDFQDNLSGNGQLAVIGNVSGSNVSGSGNGAQMVFGGSISATDANRTFASVGGYKENDTDGNRAGYLAFGTRQASSPQDIFERMRIDSTGNVGIGAVDPNTKLDIRPEGLTGLTMPTFGTAAYGGIHILPDGNAAGEMWYGITFGNTAAGDDERQRTTAGIYTSAAGNYGNKLYFATSTSWAVGAISRMMIDHTGNVGIGTTTPTYRLDVETSDDIVASFVSTDNKASIGISDNDTSVYVSAENSKASFGFNVGVHANNLNVDSTGNVGIGATSPAETLHVSGSVRVDGNTGTAPQTSGGHSPTDIYGQGDPSFYLGTPDKWLRINLDGVDYVIPAYIPA